MNNSIPYWRLRTPLPYLSCISHIENYSLTYLRISASKLFSNGFPLLFWLWGSPVASFSSFLRIGWNLTLPHFLEYILRIFYTIFLITSLVLNTFNSYYHHKLTLFYFSNLIIKFILIINLIYHSISYL